MTLYLCNVGTSASQAVLRDPEFLARYLPDLPHPPFRLDRWLVRSLGGVERAVEVMSPVFLAFDYRNDEHLRTKLSAEIHSLVRSQIRPDDRAVLFYSDTDDGEVCARLVESYLGRRLGLDPAAVRCRRVPGLQVDDAGRFRRQGVPNYFRLVLEEGDRQGWTGLVLNPTGGYKALVSYATLLGMMFGVTVCYIFDNGKELLTLPPLPVEMDHTRLAPLLPAMERIDRETAIPEPEFWGKTQFEVRAQFASLLEPDASGLVTLSPIGLLVYERLRKVVPHQSLTVYLSRQAWRDFAQAPAGWDVAGFLHRLRTAADLDRYRHPLSDGTLWLKPGSTSDRYRVELEDNRLLVFRILAHDEYLRAAGREWPRPSYAPFTRFDYVT